MSAEVLSNSLVEELRRGACEGASGRSEAISVWSWSVGRRWERTMESPGRERVVVWSPRISGEGSLVGLRRWALGLSWELEGPGAFARARIVAILVWV